MANDDKLLSMNLDSVYQYICDNGFSTVRGIGINYGAISKGFRDIPELRMILEHLVRDKRLDYFDGHYYVCRYTPA